MTGPITTFFRFVPGRRATLWAVNDDPNIEIEIRDEDLHNGKAGGMKKEPERIDPVKDWDGIPKVIWNHHGINMQAWSI